MKIAVALLGLLLLHRTGAQQKCIQGSDGTVAMANCANTVTHCSGPKFTDYQGFAANVLYACGTCAAGKGVTCTECAVTAEGGCNKPVQLGTAYTCFSFEFDDSTAKFKQKAVKTTCTIAKDSNVKCNQPTPTSAKDTYTNKNGCGPCDGSTKASNVCDDCDNEECNPLPTPIKCIQGSDGAAAATDCTDIEDYQCSKPKFTDYTGFSAVAYACGACASGTKDTTCEECDGSTGEVCNKPVGLGVDFKCYTYTYDTTKKSYTQKDTTCKRSKTAGIMCNMPATKDTAAKYTNTDGCGVCAGSTKKDEACKECTDKALCNVLPSSAERATATLLLTLAALLYCFT